MDESTCHVIEWHVHWEQSRVTKGIAVGRIRRSTVWARPVMRKVGCMSEAFFSLRAQLRQKLRRSYTPIRKQTTRSHKLATNRVETVLCDSASDIVAELERIFNT